MSNTNQNQKIVQYIQKLAHEMAVEMREEVNVNLHALRTDETAYSKACVAKELQLLGFSVN